MNTSAARKGWVNHVPSHRLRQAPALDPEARAYFTAADDLRKDRPFFTDRSDDVAALVGFGRGDAARRRLQRLEHRLELEGLIVRVLIHGRRDLVSGRETFTGRIGVIPLVTFTELPIAQGETEIAQIAASMRARARKRPRMLPFDGIVARQICPATPDSCTTDLTPHSPLTEGLERVTETTYAPEPESSSFLECMEGKPEGPQTLEVELAPALIETPAPSAIVTPPAEQALDLGILAVLIARAVKLFRLKPYQAEAKIRHAAKVFPFAWITPALDAAVRIRPNAGRWDWGIVWGTLKNFRAEGGPPPPPAETMQNLNPPAPIEPDPDPEATAAMWARGGLRKLVEEHRAAAADPGGTS